MWIPTQYLSNTTYTVDFAFTIMLNMMAFWLICGAVSIITGFFAKKFGPKNIERHNTKDNLNSSVVNENDKIFLREVYHPSETHQADNAGKERKHTGEFYETANDHKNKPLRYISSIFSWLAWFFFATIPTCYSAFSIIPIWLGVILSFLVLQVRFWISMYTNCPLSITKGRPIYKVYRQVVNMMFQIHKKKAIAGLIVVTCVAVFVNMGTYKSCINDHITASYGIPFYNAGEFLYSSALTRFIKIDKVCNPGPPCHMYATVPFDASTSVFMNVHTHVDVTNVTLNYDTQDYYNTNNGSLRYQNFTSYMLSPSDYDTRGERNIHNILLTGLEPDTTYMIQLYYDGAVQYNSTYQTLPDVNSTTPYNLTYGGDLGVSAATLAVSQMLPESNPRLLMIGGDLSYDNGEAYCYYNLDLTLFMIENNIFGQLGRIVPITLSVGNHDVGFDSLAQVNVPITESGPSYYTGFPQHYPLDANGVPEIRVPAVTERMTYHSHMIGNILNVVLDAGYMAPYNGEQLTWLQDTSQNYSQYAKVAVYHDPIITACPSSYAQQQIEDGMTYWIPMFDELNYMAVFEHHTHTFKRTFPIRNMEVNQNGTIYFGEGDWGVNPSKCDFDNSTGLFQNYASINHAWIITVNPSGQIAGGSIQYSAVLQNGTLIEAPVSQNITTYSGPSNDNYDL